MCHVMCCHMLCSVLCVQLYLQHEGQLLVLEKNIIHRRLRELCNHDMCDTMRHTHHLRIRITIKIKTHHNTTWHSSRRTLHCNKTLHSLARSHQAIAQALLFACSGEKRWRRDEEVVLRCNCHTAHWEQVESVPGHPRHHSCHSECYVVSKQDSNRVIINTQMHRHKQK